MTAASSDVDYNSSRVFLHCWGKCDNFGQIFKFQISPQTNPIPSDWCQFPPNFSKTNENFPADTNAAAVSSYC